MFCKFCAGGRRRNNIWRCKSDNFLECLRMLATSQVVSQTKQNDMSRYIDDYMKNQEVK